MDPALCSRTAIISGANRDIGRVIALACGWKVARIVREYSGRGLALGILPVYLPRVRQNTPTSKVTATDQQAAEAINHGLPKTAPPARSSVLAAMKPAPQTIMDERAGGSAGHELLHEAGLADAGLSGDQGDRGDRGRTEERAQPTEVGLTTDHDR